MTNKAKKYAYIFLRLVSGVVILLYALFRVGVPLINGEPLYLDKNDGYVLIGAISLLLSVEVINYVGTQYLKRRYLKGDGDKPK